MLHKATLGTFLFFVTIALLAAQDAGKLMSGPRPGKLIPSPFNSINVNGPAKAIFVESKNKDEPGHYVVKPHCMVCQFSLGPSVLIVAREPADGKDEPLTDLLKKLDDAVTDFADRGFSAGVIFVSPDALDSTTNAKEIDPAKLIDENVKRTNLLKRLEKRAEPLKHVLVGAAPDAPKSFNINPKADVTVLFYDRLTVIDSWAFGPDQLQAKDVDAIIKRVRKALPIPKKKLEKK